MAVPPTAETHTVVGCGDTRGQCLIHRDVLASMVPDAVIHANPQRGPSFGGVGGGVLRPSGFALIPVYILDRAALSGDTARGTVVKLHIEFQVIQELD